MAIRWIFLTVEQTISASVEGRSQTKVKIVSVGKKSETVSIDQYIDTFDMEKKI